MNLKKFNDVAYLQQLAEDKDQLSIEVRESKGYVLDRMSKHKIFPSLDNLWDDINAYSLLFIIKNYSLNREQIKEVRTFFGYGADNVITKDILSEEEVINYLKEGGILPKNTKLSLEIIKTHYKEINTQYEKDEYNTKTIMTRSLKGISVDHFLSMDSDFLKENKHLFNINPELFKNKKYQNTYKNFVLEVAEEKKYYPDIRSFKNYIFSEDDKAFLEELLAIQKKDRYRMSAYSDFIGYRGFTDLISKEEYFKKYNSENIRGFSDSQIEKNLKLIQKSFLKNIKKISYEPLNELASMEASPSQFKLLLNNDLMKDLFNKMPEIHIGYVDQDRQEAKQKFEQLQFTILNYIVNNQTEQILSKISLKDMAKSINEFAGHHRLRNTPGFGEDATKFYLEIVPKLFNSNDFSVLYGNPEFITRYTVDVIEQIAETHPSVNFLIYLLDYQNEPNRRYNSDKVSVNEIINKLIPKIDKEIVVSLSNYFNYKIPEDIKLESHAVESYQTNILNYKSIEINKMSEVSINLLLDINLEFKDYIISEKKQLDSKFVSRLMRYSENEASMSFLIKYLEINKENVIKDESLFRSIVIHPLGKKMMDFEAPDYEERDYQQFLLQIKELDRLEKDEEPTGEKYYEKPEYKVYEAKKTLIRQKVDELKKSLTFDFLTEKIKKVLKDNNFEEYCVLKDNYLVRDDNANLFAKHVGISSFNKVLKNIEDPAYITALTNSIDFSNKTELKFKKFKEEENHILAELLGTQFKDKIKPLHFFKSEVRGFLNEFIVKNMPVEMFYSYSLRPNIEKEGKSYFRENSLITTPYTNEQLIEGFNKANKIGFFSVREANASYDEIFQENFKGREKEFKDLLSLTKENNHKLYSILTYRTIYRDFHDRKINDITQDEFQANYLKNNYDIETVLKGFKEIINEIDNAKNLDYSKFNKELAFSSISSFIHSTYYDIRTIQGNTEYFSPLTQEDQNKIIDFLFKEAPYFMMEQYKIGTTGVPEYIAENFEKYANINEIINSVLMPENHMKGPSLSLDTRSKSANNRFNDYVDQIVSGMVDHYIKQKKSDELAYISYLFEKNAFTSQLNHDFKYASEANDNDHILNYVTTNPALIDKLKFSQAKFSLESLLAEKSEDKVKIKKHKI